MGKAAHHRARGKLSELSENDSCMRIPIFVDVPGRGNGSDHEVAIGLGGRSKRKQVLKSTNDVSRSCQLASNGKIAEATIDDVFVTSGESSAEFSP